MRAAVPAGARCQRHPDTDALGACPRCGSFVCAACERRLRPDAVPLCPTCWDLRALEIGTNPPLPASPPSQARPPPELAPPEGSRCPLHPEAAARWTCPRCGAFFCAGCARRTRPDAIPICPSCWALRDEKVQTIASKKQDRLAITGFVLGFFALIPLPPIQIASLVINIIGLVRKDTGPRWAPWSGLALTLAGLVISGLTFAGALASP